jgi:hypothetical protein
MIEPCGRGPAREQSCRACRDRRAAAGSRRSAVRATLCPAAARPAGAPPLAPEGPWPTVQHAATLFACGRGPHEHALELGDADTALRALLARRCRRLTTLELAAALAAAPASADVLPDGPFDLVVATGILVHADHPWREDLLEGLRERLLPGGKLVAVQRLAAGPEDRLAADAVHRALIGKRWLRHAGGRTVLGNVRVDVLHRR